MAVKCGFWFVRRRTGSHGQLSTARVSRILFSFVNSDRFCSKLVHHELQQRQRESNSSPEASKSYVVQERHARYVCQNKVYQVNTAFRYLSALQVHHRMED